MAANKVRLQKISSALLVAHKDFFRAVIVIRALDEPPTFTMFGREEGDFNVGQYDMKDGKPQGHFSVLLNFAMGVVREAVAGFPATAQKRVLEVLREWRRNVEPTPRPYAIPICFADMHHFPEGYPVMTSIDMFKEWRRKIRAKLQKDSSDLLAFLPRNSHIHPWPEMVEVDLFRFQREEQNRFVQLVRESYNTVANNFEEKLKAATNELRGVNKLWEQSPQPAQTLDRMKKLADRLQAVITDGYKATTTHCRSTG